ncbi:iron ABC transporter permease [Crenobacter sp. SG2305]|uniref:iron ABC transporter permease n=1 Tax=Crenobacter oryzisoli TaxID=3056844 RepID=UPI0025AA3B00|nr:iron ABC transporter permease [Crenobacter sp. SG2305]MDN0083586.1 iron ABC transporter permease [Crenobacter sp. SG2305]
MAAVRLSAPPAAPRWFLPLALLLVVALLLANVWPTHLADPALAHAVLLQLKLPRLGATLIAGAALGLAGALLQLSTRNPLAAPSVLGVTSGAQIGLMVSLLLPALLKFVGVPAVFAGGLLAALLTFAVAGGWRATPLRLILAGTATSLLLAALASLLLILNEQHIAGLALWSAGSLFQNGWGGVAQTLPWFVLATAGALWLRQPLAVLGLGDEAAATLGLRAAALRRRVLLIATLLAAVAVSLAGPIAFVGLIAPNLARLAGHWHPRRLVPASALAGALLLALAEAAVQRIGGSGGLPLGVATALVGTPLLIWLIQRQSRLVPPSADTLGTAVPSRRWPVLLLATLIPVLLVTGLFYGSLPLPDDALSDWLAQIPSSGALLVELRLPRLVLALTAGALLALSGGLLQQVVRNPLAGPELMGVSQGAGLAMLALVLAWPAAPLPAQWLAALVGAALVLAVALAVNRRHDYEPVRLALTGIALSALLGALAALLIVSAKVQAAQAVVWLAGSSYGRGLDSALALLPWLLLALPGLWLARALGFLAFGDEQANALGVPVARLRLFALSLAALAAALAVAAVGPVGFVGLAAPHLAGLLVGQNPRWRLGCAMLVGAVLTGVADMLGRSLLAPLDIPLGLMTAVLGAPYLLILLARQRRQRP